MSDNLNTVEIDFLVGEGVVLTKTVLCTDQEWADLKVAVTNQDRAAVADRFALPVTEPPNYYPRVVLISTTDSPPPLEPTQTSTKGYIPGFDDQ